MTKRLEELFGFDQLEDAAKEPVSETMTQEETRTAIMEIDETIDKIDEALPAIRDLKTSDTELDDISTKATEAFDDLMTLGMNVDSRFSAELFNAASSMLGHALSAKTAKLNKKLKMVDLQLKKLKLDQDAAKQKGGEIANLPQAKGQVLTRNDLLERILASGKQSDN
jgi:pimeloyl-CoA synthetase